MTLAEIEKAIVELVEEQVTPGGAWGCKKGVTEALGNLVLSRRVLMAPPKPTPARALKALEAAVIRVLATHPSPLGPRVWGDLNQAFRDLEAAISEGATQ